MVVKYKRLMQEQLTDVNISGRKINWSLYCQLLFEFLSVLQLTVTKLMCFMLVGSLIETQANSSKVYHYTGIKWRVLLGNVEYNL